MGAKPLEPWLADMVEAAIAPFREQLPEDDLAWMREQLVARLLPAPELREALGDAALASDPELGADPHLRRLVDDARGRPLVDESGNIVRRDILDGLLRSGADDGLAVGTPVLEAPVKGRAAGGRGRDGAG